MKQITTQIMKQWKMTELKFTYKNEPQANNHPVITFVVFRSDN